MNMRQIIFLAFSLALITTPAVTRADDRPAIRAATDTCLAAAAQVQEILQANQDKAAGELLAAGSDFVAKVQAFAHAADNSKHPRQAAKDEYWELVRFRRNLDATLSVSPLRKNANLKTALAQVDQTLADLKTSF